MPTGSTMITAATPPASPRGSLRALGVRHRPSDPAWVGVSDTATGSPTRAASWPPGEAHVAPPVVVCPRGHLTPRSDDEGRHPPGEPSWLLRALGVRHRPSDPAWVGVSDTATGSPTRAASWPPGEAHVAPPVVGCPQGHLTHRSVSVRLSCSPLE